MEQSVHGTQRLTEQRPMAAFQSWILRNPLLAAGILAIFIPTIIFVAKASWSTEEGGHGPIVLATGLWFLVRKWQEALPLMRPAPARRVFLMFIPLLLGYLVARVTQIVEIEGFWMYGLLLVVLYSTIGGAAMKALWFPLFYLLFVFPPPDTLVAAITQPLKIGLSQAAVKLLYTLGYPIAGAGVTMQIGQYQLFVAQACSGLNSLVSLSAISLFYVYVRHQENWRYAVILLLMIVPVAVFANFVRILILILLTYYGGESAAQGFLHNFAGLTMFVTALLTIFGLDALIQPFWRRAQERKMANG
jgi:exosortase